MGSYFVNGVPDGGGFNKMAKRLKRSSRNATIFTAVAMTCIIIISIFAVGIFFRVAEIEVSGASHYLKENIISASGINPGDNLFTLNPQYARASILDEMPIIYDIRVQRELPHRAIIYVYKSRAIATVQHEDYYLVVDSRARVLEKTQNAVQGLIEIRGFGAANPTLGAAIIPDDGVLSRLRILTEVLSAMENTEICEEVSYLDVTNIARVSFDYGRVTIFLGSPENVEVKLRRIEAAFSTYGVDPHTTRGRLDLSHRTDVRWISE